MYELHSNESHIPNNPLREDILEAANDYIGEVYAYDKGPDYLAIDRTNFKVCLTNTKFPKKPYNDWVYYDAIQITKSVPSSTAIEPDQLAIDAITLDFFPIKCLENFRKTAKTAITKFVEERGLVKDAIITFPTDTFNVMVQVPDETETVDCTDMTVEELEAEFDDLVECIDIPLSDYVRMRNGKLVIDEFKLLKVALDNYYGE